MVSDEVSSAWSLLSALFFIIFISDFPEVVLPGNIIAPSAENCKWSRMTLTLLQIKIQEELDSLHRWSLRNFMNFNVKKCKIMRITTV